MRRGPAGLGACMVLVGLLAIYLGLGIVRTGESVSGTGGAFGNELAVLGGLWKVLGAVLAILGGLCLTAAIGTAALREWGRKNGALAAFLISALAVIAGFLTGYFDLLASLPYFALAVLAVLCGLALGRLKNAFEMGMSAHGTTAPSPGYREVRYVRRSVVVRHGPAPEGHGARVECARCGMSNPPGRKNCMSCGMSLRD